TTISSAFNLITLSILLSKRLSGTIVESRRLRVAEAASDRLANPLSQSGIRKIRLSLLRSVAFSIVMAAAVIGIKEAFGIVDADGFQQIASLLGAIALGIVLYFGLHALSGGQDLRDFKSI
ncbi:MAG: hypothetical protein KDB07_04905, partial [Planctomycetes bacterium]|nr:hypothetical protein [Planctomycetota bacterium]